MSHASASPSAPFDHKQGGLLLANMLSAWLDGEPSGEATAEAVHEPKDRRPSPQPIRLCLPAPIDARPSAASSGEHGTPVRVAREGAGTGLERSFDPHPRWGPWLRPNCIFCARASRAVSSTKPKRESYASLCRWGFATTSKAASS